MDEEMQAVKDNQKWALVPRTQGMNVVDSKWVYKIKTNLDGPFQRCKARLIVQG